MPKMNSRELERASAFSLHNIIVAQKVADSLPKAMEYNKQLQKKLISEMRRESFARFGVKPVAHAEVPVYFSKSCTDELMEKAIDIATQIANDCANDRYQTVPTIVEITINDTKQFKVLWTCLSWHNAIVSN